MSEMKGKLLFPVENSITFSAKTQKLSGLTLAISSIPFTTGEYSRVRTVGWHVQLSPDQGK